MDKVPNQATYHYGDVVQLTANPALGWQFSAWSGDLTGSENPKNITINGNKTVTATFYDITPPTYTPTANGLWVVVPFWYQGGAPYYYYYHQMTAVAATDASLPLTYWFECVSGNSEDWISPPQGGGVTYTPGPFLSPNPASYKVHIRDAVGNEVVSSTWNTHTGYVSP